jgi:hypothetical protein
VNFAPVNKQGSKMKKVTLSLLIASVFILGARNQAMSQDNTKVFQQLIKQYEQSINQADTLLAAALWSKSNEVSFINPRSTEYGWNGSSDRLCIMFTQNHKHITSKKYN